jgi:SWI/SNF-related matrix-associated actin-dependent regulator 1 of chromatin subfamily A
MLYPNKYAKQCNNPACRKHVAVGAGYIQKINNNWVTWCAACVPERITTAPPKEVRRELTASGEVHMPFEPDNLPLLRAMPGARWNAAGKFWTVSTADSDRSRVLELADRIGLKVADEFRAISFTESAQNALYAGLYPFQVEGVNWLSKQSNALLGDDMGLGKSVQALMSLPSDGYGIIVAPAGLKYNWLDECKKWRDDLTCTVIEGRGNFRLPRKNEIVVVNYDILPDWLLTPKKPTTQSQKDYYASLNTWRNDLKAKHPGVELVTLIVDEAHKVKNYKTKQSQKVKNLSSICKNTWGLTGTPLVNRPTDLYGVLDSLNMSYKVFGGLPRFRTLFNAWQDRFGWKYGDPQPIVPELLRRVMLRRKREQVLPDLPTKTYTTLTVGDVDPALRRQMDEMWEEFGGVVEIDEELPPFEKFSKLRHDLAKSRIEAMLEYVENAEEQDVPLVVFSAHLPPLDALLVRDGWAVISGDTKPERRQEIVRDFQAGKLKGVGVSIKAGGVGLTLTRAWKVLFVDLDWTPAANTQAEDRICRIGQTSNKVEVVRMVSDHPLDIHVNNLLSKKMALIQASIENSVAGAIKQYAGRPATEGETEEQFQERMAKIVAAQQELAAKQQAEKENNQKALGKAKAGLIHGREKARATRTILPLTASRIVAVKDAFKYMLSVCDGAHAKDGLGFNKPDAGVARYLVWAGLENQTELEAAYYMLTRYFRQLSDKWPNLFYASEGDQDEIVRQAKQAG